MNNNDKFNRRIRTARGNVKKFLGKATENPRLTSEGRRDQARGNLGQAAEKLRKAFKR